jgi:hypothetical protein
MRSSPELADISMEVSADHYAMQVLPELPSEDATTEPEEAPARGSLMRAGMTVLWMVLLAAGYAWRACSGS